MWLKRKPIRSKTYTSAARGQACTMNSPWCNWDPSTTVLAHSNWAEDGKGASRKADDIFGADLCSDCHRWLDAGPAGREEKRDAFHRAMKVTQRRRWDQGLLTVGSVKRRHEDDPVDPETEF